MLKTIFILLNILLIIGQGFLCAKNIEYDSMGFSIVNIILALNSIALIIFIILYL